MRGSDLVVQSLIDHGVRYLPGISGNSIFDILDSMYDRPEIKYITVRHEQVAAGMADGWARATGETGTFITHVGPGVCQAVVGMAAAYRDSVPLVLLTGNQDQDKLGRDQWHEIDQLGIMRPVVKWSARIERPQDAPRIIRQAYVRARLGRPGPVHVDIPKDVSLAKLEKPEAVGTTKPSPIARRVWPDPEFVRRACEIFLNAQRPILVVGGGVYWSGGAKALTDLAEALGVPVVTTTKGRGNIPEDHPLCMGMIGQYGTIASNKLLKDADAVLAVGSRLSDVSTLTWSLISPGTRIIQVDIDPNEMARQYPVDLGILADARCFLESFHEAAAKMQGAPRPRDREALASLPRIQAAQAERKAELEHFFDVPEDHVPIKPQLVAREVARALRRDAFVTLGAGFHPQYSNKVPIYHPGGYIKALALGAMGLGFAQAMGAKLAFPDRQVVHLTGDGDFAMTAEDLETCVREGIHVVSVVLDDVGFNSLRTFQRHMYKGRIIGSDYRDVNLGKLAEVYGALGERITDPKALGPALRRMLEANRPAVLDVMIDPMQEPPRFFEIRKFLGLTK
jgi:acetolactate synthase-1/2/3 large subunit